MPLDTTTVTHDTASLYRFVHSVCRLAEESSSSVYVKASDAFFDYVRQLGTKTKEYLESFPGNLPANDFLKSIHRQKLTTIRGAWAELHQFLKPAADADTLNTPFSLLEALYEKFHAIAGFEKVEFTVIHLNELNYLQVRASWIRELAQKLATQIPGAPPFPTDLGLIGIPYSQSSSVFLNALIPHEMGHFVFQQRGTLNTLLPEINASLDAELAGGLLPANSRRWCVDKLGSWAEEIFCDLFAVWMLGPAHVYAFVELLDLANIPSIASIPLAPREYLGFHPRHPADALRISEHVKFLRKLGWWTHVATVKSHYVEALTYVEQIPNGDYGFPSDVPTLAQLSLRAYFRLLPEIERTIESLVGSLHAGASEYSKCELVVQDYLHRGVVPSTIQILAAGGPSSVVYPDPVSVLNVAYKIHLESLEILLSQVSEDVRSVRARSEWAMRLELWAAKAFEDYSLLSKKP